MPGLVNMDTNKAVLHVTEFKVAYFVMVQKGFGKKETLDKFYSLVIDSFFVPTFFHMTASAMLHPCFFFKTSQFGI